jgi:hypothetical protein
MKGEAMEPDRTTQSAELTRIEKLTADWIPESPWPTAVAWMKNREATERRLLGMVEKLTDARARTVGADPPKTPAPACDVHRWLFISWVDGLEDLRLGLHACQTLNCPALNLGGTTYLPETQTPVSREEPKRPPLVSG